MVRDRALVTRMFERDTLPWECAEHEPVEIEGLGRVWPTCNRCGFLLDQGDRERLLEMVRELT